MMLAFRAARHDHRVLHLLGLYQSQHFGAEVVRPLAPAQSAARDRAESQVQACRARTVHEHLAGWPRIRHLLDCGAVELEGGPRPSQVAIQVAEVAGPDRRLDQVE
jgi:hypothetical protein